ncbi:hypothetical protein FRC07_014049, partial [Ceratobasidium sp. 392]
LKNEIHADRTEASDGDSSEGSYDEEEHKILLLGLIEECEFDQLSLVDKILLDLAFILADNYSSATDANIGLHCYFEDLDVSQPYQSRIEDAVRLLERGISCIPDSDKWKPHLLGGLSLTLKLRFEHNGGRDDIDEAIKCGRKSLTLAPAGNSTRPLLLDILGDIHIARFERFGHQSDIKHAVQYCTEATQIAPENHEELATFFSNLGRSLKARASCLDETEDLDQAIECLSKALSLTTDKHPKMPMRLKYLGSALSSRFGYFGQALDAEIAISHHTKALLLIPEEHEDRVLILDSLGSTYASRYRHFGDLTDLENAVMYHTKAVDLALGDHTESPILLHNLGNSLQSRFAQLGRLADIDKAIECHHAAVKHTPEDHYWHAGHLVGLGNSYAIRFAHRKNITDIEVSIDLYNEALSLAHHESGFRVSLLNSLGSAHFWRFQHFQKSGDIDRAIHFFNEALLLVPDEHTRKPYLLANLGRSYQELYMSRGQVADLDQSILCLGQAVALVPSGHTSKPRILRHLASSHYRRLKHHEERADLDSCMAYASEALSLVPEEHIDKPEMLYDIGFYHHIQFQFLGESQMIQKSMFYSEEATQSPSIHPATRFFAAWELCISMRLAKTGLLIKAYERVIQLLPSVVWLRGDIDNRFDNLMDMRDLPTEAAAVAFDNHETELALEWLEAGSSIIWKQMDQLRSPFDELHAKHPAIASRLKEVAQQLDVAGISAPTILSIGQSELGAEHSTQRRHRLAEEWDRLLDQVRLLPEFNYFMRPKKARELTQAARDRTVVVINVHESRCDALALIVNQEEPIHILLPNLSHDKAERARVDLVSFLRGSGARTRKFKKYQPGSGHRTMSSLGTLWLDVVNPILEQLNYVPTVSRLIQDTRSEKDLPHVTWLLTGPLVFLPLHAAGLYHMPEGPRAYKYIVSSYTPTTTALLSAGHAPEHFQGILAVAQPATPGVQPLPGTLEEISRIEYLAGHLPCTRLEGDAATATTVLEAMDEHSWVHLACHATQDSTFPMNSAFILHDSTLDLHAIASKSLTHARFAFLSACETATGDDSLPEQAVHLAAGMMMAGYPSVIATMWSIRDRDGPVIAEKVYAYMLEGGVPDSSKAARAFHAAVGQLRKEIGEQEFVRWVPFIHMGL